MTHKLQISVAVFLTTINRIELRSFSYATSKFPSEFVPAGMYQQSNVPAGDLIREELRMPCDKGLAQEQDPLQVQIKTSKTMAGRPVHKCSGEMAQD